VAVTPLAGTRSSKSSTKKLHLFQAKRRKKVGQKLAHCPISLWIFNMSATLPRTEPASIPNYRQTIRKALKQDILKPDPANVAWYLVHFAILALCYWGLTFHFSYWSAPILALLIGHSFGCMGFLAHDIAHGGSIRHPVLRDALAAIGFSPFGISPYLWRRWHNADHHNNTQIEGLDPDHLFTLEHYQTNPVLRWLYRIPPLLRNLIIFSSFTYRMTQQTLRMVGVYLKSPKSTTHHRWTILWQTMLAFAFWIGSTWWLGPHVLLWGYLVPMLFANAMVISYIATNHFLNPLADERDVLATSLSVTLPKGLRWLDPWHHAFGAHVAHHLFPNAPAKYARQIEEKVAELYPDRFHCMPITKALKALWDTPWIYEDHHTLIDPNRQIRMKTLGNGLEKSLKD
jgi:fatty acid desaturase